MLESKKHQTFSLGALWRISLALKVDMYKLCIDENMEKQEEPKFLSYKCNQCEYETDIPYELIELLNKANSICTNIDNILPVFKCAKCSGVIIPKSIEEVEEKSLEKV